MMIAPLPSLTITRAMAALRRPTALTVSIVQRLLDFVDVDYFGLLSLVWVVWTIVHVHVLNDASAKTVLGEHTFHYMNEQGVHAGLEVFVEGFLHQYLWGSNALTAGIACVAEVLVIGPFFACEDNFVGIDDDDIVSTFYKRRVAGLVFATENLGHFRAKSAEVLSCSVDKHPFFLYALCIGGDGFVT